MKQSEQPQIRKNLVLNIMQLLCNVLIGIYYTPYLVNSLGVAAYGVVPLALLVNQYIAVITASITNALTRFYAVAAQRHDYVEASRAMSSSFFVLLAFAVLLIPVSWLFVRHIDNVFTIPPDLLQSTQRLFAFSIGSFVLSLFSSVLNVTLYAENRLDWLNVINIGRQVLKFAFTIILFECVAIDVAYIGCAALCSEVFVLLASLYFYFQTSSRQVHIAPRWMNYTALASIMGMAVWTVVHQIGDVGIYRIDNIIVNRVWNTTVSGALGVVSDFGTYVLLFVSVISSLFGPLILRAYSRGEHDDVQWITLDSSAFVGVLAAIACGVLMGYSAPILQFWINDSFVQYSNWLSLKLLPVPFYAAAGVYAFTNRAWNKVKYPALCTVACGIVSILALSLLARAAQGDYWHGVSWMLWASTIIIVLQSYGVNAIFFVKSYPNNAGVVLKNALKILFATLFAYGLAIFAQKIVAPKNLFIILGTMAFCGIVMLVIAWFCLMSSRQRKNVLSLFYNRQNS